MNRFNKSVLSIAVVMAIASTHGNNKLSESIVRGNLTVGDHQKIQPQATPTVLSFGAVGDGRIQRGDS